MAVFLFIIQGITGIFSSDAPVVNNVTIVPPLDISRFAPYTLEADIDRFPEGSSATTQITGINGDGGNYWNYYTNGTPTSESITRNLSYDSESGKWKSSNIFPDNIYPEIFFAPSSITWNNTPSNIDIRRNNYHLMHFANPFTITSDMNIWIEFNAYRRSALNSADLSVYLVEKGHEIDFFNSDWRNNAAVELVGTINRNTEFNHAHTNNSSHHLVSLATNANSRVGTKNLDISGDFWILLYSQSPNSDRGWDLRYQNSDLCSNNNRWYTGSQSGWTSSEQTGCPDAHIHVARRSQEGGIRDGVRLVTSASFGGETGTKTQSYYYSQLPNLAPNASSFITPTVGGTYAGDISVTWSNATDPNNDTLAYDLYLLDNDGNQVGNQLLTASDQLSYNLQTNTPGSEIPNGNYKMKGRVCDQGVPENDPPDAPLCTEYTMPGTFAIDNTNPIRSLSNISIFSNNTNTSYAKAGEIVTLSFTSSASISTPSVVIYSGGASITNSTSVTSPNSTNWTATYEVNSADQDGSVSFTVSSSSLDAIYYDTSDNSAVIVDKTPPSFSSTTPADNANSGILPTTNLIINFNENITLVGGKKIYLKNVSNNEIFEEFTVDGTNVTTNEATVTIDPVAELINKSAYYVQIDSGAYFDVAGNYFTGISDTTSWNFTVGDVTAPTLTTVEIISDNAINNIAIPGNTITLSLISSETINTPEVSLKSGGITVTGTPVITNTSGNNWSINYLINENDTDGDLSFTIIFSDLANNAGLETTSTTNSSSVVVGTSKPGTPLASPVAGTYLTSQNVILVSAGATIIRYAIDGSTPTCDIGTLYSSSILISSATTIKAIACNNMGNSSNVATFVFAISTATPENNSVIEGSNINASSNTNTNSGATTSSSNKNSSVTQSNLNSHDEYGEVTQLYSVKVYLVKDDKPITDTKVELYSAPCTENTDLNGVARFNDVEPGEHKVKIHLADEIIERDLNIEGDDKEVIVNFNLGSNNFHKTLYCYILLIFLIILLFILLIYKRNLGQSKRTGKN